VIVNFTLVFTDAVMVESEMVAGPTSAGGLGSCRVSGLPGGGHDRLRLIVGGSIVAGDAPVKSMADVAVP
jgi:hypothetical protein